MFICSATRSKIWFGILALCAFGLGTVHSEDSIADKLEALPGFKVEHLLKADPKTNGSWINLCKDHKGRLILGGQSGQPVTRVTLKDGKVEKQENLNLALSETMGLLCIGDTLYVNGKGKNDKGGACFGLFRCRYDSEKDNYESPEFLREWKGGSGEHGAHGLVLDPDKKHIYSVNGNFTEIPADLAPGSPHRNYADDLPLKRSEDGNRFGANKVPPGGSIIRMDLDGKNPELYSSGERNTYDIAFNADGELFGFDSDMEYDWGTPWYRPIRVFHSVSGGDQGFREGTAKWPEYYLDSLPAAVNVGIGCPTGVIFGTGAKFPAKYQKAFFILDWTYGRLIAAHLKPFGASYTGTWENFVAPKSLHSNVGKTPLQLTDAIIGDDGAMYFTIGGRGNPAHLFRVSYIGDEPTAATDLHDKEGEEARALRHKIESYHSKNDPAALDFLWPQLSSSDRWIRYAARIAVERIPVDKWQAKALAEAQPEAALTALLSLARLGGADVQPAIVDALGKFPAAKLTEPQLLDKLRVIQVTIARQGQPRGDVAKKLIDDINPLFPSSSVIVNREMCQVLLALEAPDAVTKTMALTVAAKTQEEQIGYLLHLRTVRPTGRPKLRKQYFGLYVGGQEHFQRAHPDYVTQWFTDAGRPYGDGASYPRFLEDFHGAAKATLSADELPALTSVLDAYKGPGPKPPKKAAAPRKVVKEWTTDDLVPSLAEISKGRDFDRGAAVFKTAQCVDCHKFGNEGGGVGPELVSVIAKYDRKYILESMTWNLRESRLGTISPTRRSRRPNGRAA